MIGQLVRWMDNEILDEETGETGLVEHFGTVVAFLPEYVVVLKENGKYARKSYHFVRVVPPPPPEVSE